MRGWEDAQRMHTRIIATALETVTSLRKQIEKQPNDEQQ